MNGFKGFTDEDFRCSKMSAGATISMFVWVLAMVLGLFIG